MTQEQKDLLVAMLLESPNLSLTRAAVTGALGLLTVTQMAAGLGTNYANLAYAIRTERVRAPSFKIGRTSYYWRHELDEVLRDYNTSSPQWVAMIEEFRKKTRKFTDSELVALRAEYAAGGTTYPALAKKYHAHPMTVYKAVKGRETYAANKAPTKCAIKKVTGKKKAPFEFVIL